MTATRHDVCPRAKAARFVGEYAAVDSAGNGPAAIGAVPMLSGPDFSTP